MSKKKKKRKKIKKNNNKQKARGDGKARTISIEHKPELKLFHCEAGTRRESAIRNIDVLAPLSEYFVLLVMLERSCLRIQSGAPEEQEDCSSGSSSLSAVSGEAVSSSEQSAKVWYLDMK